MAHPSWLLDAQLLGLTTPEGLLGPSIPGATLTFLPDKAELVEGEVWTTLNPLRGRPRSRPVPPGLLSTFMKLADAPEDAVLAFVTRYGPINMRPLAPPNDWIGLVNHFGVGRITSCQKIRELASEVRALVSGYLEATAGDTTKDRIEEWRGLRWVHLSGHPYDRSLVQLTGQGGTPFDCWYTSGDPVQVYLDYATAIGQSLGLGLWLSATSGHAVLRWNVSDVSAALAFQLWASFAAPSGLAACKGCNAWFQPREKGASGRRRYCLDCSPPQLGTRRPRSESNRQAEATYRARLRHVRDWNVQHPAHQFKTASDSPCVPLYRAAAERGEVPPLPL